MKQVPQGAGQANNLPGSYRDVLARRWRHPVVIERTDKRAGDRVLDSWARPVREVSHG